MFFLTLVFFFTAIANDALSADYHALICHIIDRREPWVDPTVSCISTKIETLVVLPIVKISWDLIATSSGRILWKAFDWVGSLPTTQVSGFGCVEEVLLHICGHLHYL